MVAVEALPDEPSGGGEAMVSIACGVLEGCDRLSCKRGAVVHLYPSHPTRAIPHPHELEHPLSRLPILTEHLEEVAPAQHEQRAGLDGPHCSVAWFVGEQGRLPEEGAGIQGRQLVFAV